MGNVILWSIPKYIQSWKRQVNPRRKNTVISLRVAEEEPVVFLIMRMLRTEQKSGEQMRDPLVAYVALGDSMSIDLYPHLDLRRSVSSPLEPVGAASLLFRNHEQTWPEFKGVDLISSFPDIALANFAEDGAHARRVTDQTALMRIQSFAQQPILITITAGGNDLLSLIRGEQPLNQLTVAKESLRSAMSAIEREFPRAIVMVTTVYDPSDGTGELPGYPKLDRAVEKLNELNQHIGDLANQFGALLADVHSHFFGHGMSAPPQERWYWDKNPIEPSARGASEIRRVWFKELVDYGIISPCCAIWKS